jgi:hypothetical protein
MSNSIRIVTKDKKTGKKKITKFNSLIDAAQASRIPYMTLYMRLRHGWPLQQALKVPVRRFTRRYVLRELKDAA